MCIAQHMVLVHHKSRLLGLSPRYTDAWSSSCPSTRWYLLVPVLLLTGCMHCSKTQWPPSHCPLHSPSQPLPLQLQHPLNQPLLLLQQDPSNQPLLLLQQYHFSQPLAPLPCRRLRLVPLSLQLVQSW